MSTPKDDEYSIGVRKAMKALAEYNDYLCTLCPASDECPLKGSISKKAIQEAESIHSSEEWDQFIKLHSPISAELLIDHVTHTLINFRHLPYPRSLVIPDRFFEPLAEAHNILREIESHRKIKIPLE